MAIAITIQPDQKQLAELQAAFDRLSKTGRKMRPVLGRIGLFVRREAQRSLRSRVKEWGPSSGRLSKSLAMRLEEASVTIGSNLVYAAIQQLGGTVRPRSVKYLAIPVLPHLRRRGVWPRDLPRGSMKFVLSADIRIGSKSWRGPALVRAQEELGELEGSVAGGKYRQNRDTQGRFVKGGSRAGGTAQQARGKVGEVMFALVRKVTIKGRPYLKFDAAAQAFSLRQIEAEYQKAARKGS